MSKNGAIPMIRKVMRGRVGGCPRVPGGVGGNREGDVGNYTLLRGARKCACVERGRVGAAALFNIFVSYG